MYNDYREYPELSKRPDRDTVINADDITNLIITLNTTESVDQFCAVV